MQTLPHLLLLVVYTFPEDFSKVASITNMSGITSIVALKKFISHLIDLRRIQMKGKGTLR